MIRFKVSASFDAWVRELNALGSRQIPFAASLGLNLTAKEVKAAEEDEIRNVFDRPNPFTQRSIFMKPATKSRLEARVWLKDDFGTRDHYLVPQVMGGARELKRFEFLLRRVGVLPPGFYIVPGGSAPLDQYGNVKRGEIAKILSYFQSFYLSGTAGNTTAEKRAKLKAGTKRKAGMEYMVIRERRGGLAPGIWRVDHMALGRRVSPVLMFVKQPTYRKRFDFYGVAQRVIDARLETNFRDALQRALATAR